MKIDKFDQLTEKLLNKLNEDYVLLEGTDEDADGLMDPNESLQKSLKAKVNKESEEASKSFNNIKKFPNSPNKDINRTVHKKEVIDREDAKNKLRKTKFADSLTESTDILTSEDLTDFEMKELAEEFEFDLEEANTQMLDNAKKLEAVEKQKMESEKTHYKDEKEQMQQNKETLLRQADAKKEQQQQDQKQESLKMKDEMKKEETDKETKYKQTMAKHEAKLQKINAIKETAKKSGGQQPMAMNEEYDENVALFKAEAERIQALEEDFKQRSAQRKVKRAYKKLDKAQKKEGELAVKRDELTKKYHINDENAKDFEELFMKERDKRKAFKIKKKWAKLSHKLDEIHRFKVIPADDEAQEAEYKLKQTNESYDIDDVLAESCDVLISEIDALFEEFPYDANFCAEADRGIKYPATELMPISESNDPIVNKIARVINEQLLSDDPDYELIKSLKIKLNEYKK